MAKYKFSPTPDNIRNIEYILPKLKYSSYIGNLVKWLENFDEDEVQYAIDFLMFFEYITLDELQLRLTEQLSMMVKTLPVNHNILLVPFANYVKSNDIIAYLISKTMIYRDLKDKGRIDLTRNFKEFNYNNPTVLVFIDDFIGTGDSFLTFYKEKSVDVFMGNTCNIFHQCFLLAAIVMNKGYDLLHLKIPELTIFAEKRVNIFCNKNSPFIISHGARKMKALALKYGEKLVIVKRGGQDVFYPLGYGMCEALISFDYGPPNNTIPIIWSSDKWHPIFPRLAKDKMKQAKEIKKSVAFYLGVMKMLKIGLYDDTSIEVKGRTYSYSAKRDHALITVLTLLSKNYNKILICQIIGITLGELNAIFSYGQERRLLDPTNSLTSAGISLVKVLLKKAGSQTFRSKKRSNFEIKNLIFVPKQFQGHI